jgi:hypothetical protein
VCPVERSISIKEEIMGSASIPRIGVLATLAFLTCPEFPRPVEAQVVNPCEGLAEWALFVDRKPGPDVEMVPADEFVESTREDAGAIQDFIQSEPPNGLGIGPDELGRVLSLSPEGKVSPTLQDDLIERCRTQEPKARAPLPCDEALTKLLQAIDQGRDGQLPRAIDQGRDRRPPLVIGETVPEALQGIGGFSTTLLLKKLLRIADPRSFLDPVVYGKIRDYIFLEKPGEMGSGHMSVDVCIDPREFVPLGEDWREFFHWDIEILPDIFSYMERKPPSDRLDPNTYNDPFPGVSLPREAVDPTNPRSIWRRGLDHKLHAGFPFPEGTSIIVRNVYRRLSNTDLRRLDASDQVYISTKDSCIDLFTAGSPPATFGELVEHAYCLGRCAHPAIFNTGGSGAWERPD